MRPTRVSIYGGTDLGAGTRVDAVDVLAERVRVEALPVYLKTVNLKPALTDADLAKVIDDYLDSVKSARGGRPAG